MKRKNRRNPDSPAPAEDYSAGGYLAFLAMAAAVAYAAAKGAFTPTDPNSLANNPNVNVNLDAPAKTEVSSLGPAPGSTTTGQNGGGIDPIGEDFDDSTVTGSSTGTAQASTPGKITVSVLNGLADQW